MAHHVDRYPRLGLPVVISESWYYLEKQIVADKHVPTGDAFSLLRELRPDFIQCLRFADQKRILLHREVGDAPGSIMCENLARVPFLLWSHLKGCRLMGIARSTIELRWEPRTRK
jgi:hypothetical protein